jgi:hypothetical protein
VEVSFRGSNSSQFYRVSLLVPTYALQLLSALPVFCAYESGVPRLRHDPCIGGHAARSVRAELVLQSVGFIVSASARRIFCRGLLASHPSRTVVFAATADTGCDCNAGVDRRFWSDTNSAWDGTLTV